MKFGCGYKIRSLRDLSKLFAISLKSSRSNHQYIETNFVPFHTKGALAWYGKLTWESAHVWILKILCYLIVWGITLIFMVRLSFYAIPLLIYDVMNDIIIIPSGTQL